jgi:hypothetical protein
MYRLSRARLAANLLAFSNATDKTSARNQLKSELHMLQRDYKALLYGGTMMLQVHLQARVVLSTGRNLFARSGSNLCACVHAGASEL